MDNDRLKALVDETEAAIIGWKDLFHQNPEISLREEHTSGKIVEIIEELGLSWERVGEYGIIAYLPGKKPGKTVLLRADMDALPVDESEMNLKGRKKCCSLKKSVSHACGHDAHMAMMLGAMRVLYQIREELEGNVIFAFEQAEEVGKGIDPMMAALEKYAIDTCFGIHVFAELEEGKISVQSGPRMAALTAFTVKVIGKGGHASRPDLTVNPLMCAANILVNLNTIWSQELDSTKVVTLGITMMHCGEKGNVVADFAEFSGSLRYTDVEEGKKAFQAVQRVCEHVAKANRCSVEYPKIFESPHLVFNDSRCSKIAEDGIAEIWGRDHLAKCPVWFASESMSLYQEKYPGVFAFLGIKNEEEGYGAAHHTKEFDMKESVLKYGTLSAVKYTLDFLKQ